MSICISDWVNMRRYLFASEEARLYVCIVYQHCIQVQWWILCARARVISDRNTGLVTCTQKMAPFTLINVRKFEFAIGCVCCCDYNRISFRSFRRLFSEVAIQYKSWCSTHRCKSQLVIVALAMAKSSVTIARNCTVWNNTETVIIIESHPSLTSHFSNVSISLDISLKIENL